MSVPQSNSTQTSERLMALELRTRRTPAMPVIAVSIGNVTYCSTSSAARPPDSLRTTTVGALSSGKTSIGMSRSVIAVKPSRTAAAMSTRAEWVSENRIRARSMSAPSWVSVPNPKQ
jgi:hypothetical protein